MAYSAPKLTVKNVLTQNEFQLTIEQLPGVYWTSISGLKEVKESGEYNDGVSNRKRFTNGGIMSVENITLKVPYDIETFEAVSTWCDTFRDGGVTDVTVRPVIFSQKNGASVLAKAFYLGNCRFVSLDAFGELDSGSSDVSYTTLELSVEFFTTK